jgi:L-asparaginase
MVRKKVSIIYTGGTLGMRSSAKGYVPAKDLNRFMHARLPELDFDSMPTYQLTEYQHPLESSNATPLHWYQLAEQISRDQDKFDGFVVIHGTDTLAYAASALSFLLGDFRKPVILTGSQIPLCECRSDAQSNLISAMQAIVTGRIQEVCICFGRHILRGNRSTKVNATELDAFQSPNFPPLAEIGTEIRFSEPTTPTWNQSLLDGAPFTYRDCNIVVLPVFPGMTDRLIDAIVASGTMGIVLRCYGVGTAPTENRQFLAALQQARDAGVVIVAVSQSLQGRVSLRHYAAGSELAEVGVVSGCDMTTEAAFTKLHRLFTLGMDRVDIAHYMHQNLRGELTITKTP